jgi:dTDP-4-amino-4,6-dideoxygalactose transaminase
MAATRLRNNMSSPVPLLDLRGQYASIRDEIRLALDRVLESQQFILGPEVEAFEAEAAAYCQCRFAVGVSSGTDALLAALMASGIGAGDEVITTPYTFFATAGSISRLGARPVFVDIDEVTFNLNPSAIEAKITPRTKAIVPVHLFGQMAEMDPILNVARAHQLAVIEDAAQAIGSEYKGRRAGSMGDMACFSFFPSKNLGGFGDAGMVTTNDASLADRLRLLRNHGSTRTYENEIVGGNFRLDAIQAAVLRVKLKYLEGWTEGRRRNAKLYREMLPSAIVAPVELPGHRHIYNQFVIRSPQRDPLLQHLRNQSIGNAVYYPTPLHLLPCFRELGGKPGDFPISEAAARESLALPIYPELTPEMIGRVVQAIADI